MSALELFDVLLVGGGPAGTATALSLARDGLSVAILERSRYEDVRVGESLPPDVRVPLSDLGLWDRFLAAGHQPSRAYVSAWGSAEVSRHDFIFSPYGRGWHLDRSRFDAMLAAAAEEAGARVLRGANVRSAVPAGAGWRVTGQRNGSPFALESAYVVDAAGRTSGLSRRLGGRRWPFDRLIGTVASFSPGPRSQPLAEELLLEAVEDGWWYSAPLPGGRAVVAFMTDAGFPEPGARGFWKRFQRAPLTRERLRGYDVVSTPIVRPAHTSLLEPPPAPRFLAVGDALCSVDPLSSQGISRALRSGLRAAQAIRMDRQGDREAFSAYHSQVRQDFKDYLSLWLGYYEMETRWPGSSFWDRRRPSAAIPGLLGSLPQ